MQRLIWMGAAVVIATFGLGYILFLQPAKQQKKAALLRHGQLEIDLAERWELERWEKLGEGNVIVGIARDPELDIAHMLERAASLAVPENCEVKIVRDSFTEFDIHVTAGEKVGIDRLVAATMRFMPHCWEFVNSVSYQAPDGPPIELGRREIESVGDWHRIDRHRLSRMLTRL